jgi:large subunit ribosomal protein L10
MTRAFKGTEFEGLTSSLEGTNAIAVSKDDATAPARIVSEFAKNCPALELKAGVVEGVVYDENGIKEIANIPSRDVLLSRFLGSLQSPITNFARVLNQIAEKNGEGAPAVEAAPAE